MRRKEAFPVSKHTLYFYSGDFERLKDLHPRINSSAKVVRLLVRGHINRAEAAARNGEKIQELATDE